MSIQPTGAQQRSVNVQVLPSASNVVITGGSFTGVQQNVYTDPLERLYSRVAPNAILNAGGRADDVRCHPGTREEVIGITEKWIDGDGDLSRTIFWLSGPAGAGKTAIIQTIAERCIQRNAPMANYFFFRADTSRNNTGSVVPTLLYQILQFYPALKAEITTLLETKPLIFDQSIRDQFKHLIDNPIRPFVDNSAYPTRLVLFIDGLDECSSDTKNVQGDLLHALHRLTSEPTSPFVVLVASRAEPHLVMLFNEIGSSKDSIFLDENYHPAHDIRLFVTAEFAKIKRNHRLGQTLGDDWPSEAIIDEIVHKSSGQFIYAATVMRFISSSPASPAHSLERVRGIRPIVKSSPFAQLDAIYAHILSRAEDWELAKDVIAGHFLLRELGSMYIRLAKPFNDRLCPLLRPLGATQSDIESSLSDLVAVVQYNRETKRLIFYHASLEDFLFDKSRSNDLYIDLASCKAKLALVHMPAMSSFEDVELFCGLFSVTKIATPLLKDALIAWEPWHSEILCSDAYTYESLRTLGGRCLLVLRKTYHKDDNLFYRTILRKWLMWFSASGVPKPSTGHGPQYDQEISEIWDDIRKSRTEVKSPPKVAFWKRVGEKFGRP